MTQLHKDSSKSFANTLGSISSLGVFDKSNRILQFTDMITTRRFSLRMYDGHENLTLEQLLEFYLRHPNLERLTAEHRLTEESAELLNSIQDLVYKSSNDGTLQGMFAGLEFLQGSHPIALGDIPRPLPMRFSGKEVSILDVKLDRTNVGYDRNWIGFNRRRWDLHSSLYETFVRSTLEKDLGTKKTKKIMALDTTESCLKLVEVLARCIWESDFENYSRFIGRKLVYKSGDETVRNIVDGSGGICSEKVQALKFLTDFYGINSEYVICGPNTPERVPEGKLRELLTTFDFSFAKRYLRYWQHTALRYNIDGTSVLVDDTNGNIPFLFLNGAEADRYLGYKSKKPLVVKMGIEEESLYYHPVSQDIMLDLFFAMEGWISHIDLVQVFDNELGLCITKDFMITPVVYRTEAGFQRLRNEYLKACEDAGVSCEIVEDWTLNSILGDEFAENEPRIAEKVLGTKEHLLNRYENCFGGSYEATLAIIRLKADTD